MQSKPKKRKPPDPALAATFLNSTICFPLCLSGAVTVGFHLPCPVLRLRCSFLGIDSQWASSHWPIQALRESFRPELRQWRLVSLGLSNPEFSVVCGEWVSFGCRRYSTSAIMQLARYRGSRSGIIASLDYIGLSRSVSIASFCSFPCYAQVCSYLPIPFHIVLIDYLRNLISSALRLISFDTSDYWNGMLRLTLLWQCLNLNWSNHVVICEVDTCWCSGWHVGIIKPCNLRTWAMERPVYGLVATLTRFHRSPGNASLFLHLLMIESSTLNCSPVWVSFEMLWFLLLLLHFLRLYTQCLWPTWVIHLLVLLHARRYNHRLWTSVSLTQCIRRVLGVLTLVLFARFSISLVVVFERTLDYTHIGPFMCVPRDKNDGVQHAVLSRFSSCCLVYFMLWLITCWLDSLMSEHSRTFEALGLFYFTVTSCSTLFTLVWLWWQVLCVILIFTQPLPQRHFSLYCLDQHVYMLRTHLWMPSQPLHRGWTFFSMMIAFAIKSDILVDFPVPRAFPSYLLSPSSACLFAQKPVAWSMCFCWHPAWPLRNGDEVKGMVPIVYEEIFSETRPSLCRTCIWFPSFWWFISDSQQFSWLSAFKTAMQPSTSAFVIVKQHFLSVLAAVLAVMYKCLYLITQDFFRMYLYPINASTSSAKGFYGLLFYLWSLFFRKSGYDFLLCYKQA